MKLVDLIRDRYILVSLWGHITLMMAFWLLSFYLPVLKGHTPLSSNKAFIEVKLMTEKDSPAKKEKTFLRDLEIPDEIKKRLDNQDEPALFLSKTTQRVKKETRALKIGPTQNRPRISHSPLQVPPKAVSQLTPLSQQAQLVSPVGDSARSVVAALPPLESTVGILVPQTVEVGEFTALNTDRFTFYTFFERIESSIRFIWEGRVRKVLGTFGSDIKRLLPTNYASTIIEVQLNSEGRVVKILLLKSSGVSALDEACAYAFWEVKEFKNPPKELIESDGLIHLRYQFIVYLR
ncbi:MAG: hypothetical protein NZ480_04305 [Bdellovibrionaceae bacterium]|nr:hypothetical protein [Pseudobdellovibrionaceae bacterium]MDW8189969.1 hypothetical protein [Pseudobdellovibrionaceae bacterium]